MQLLITETITQQYGVDADTDDAGLKALDNGTASIVPGTKTVHRRVVLRLPSTQTNVDQAKPTIQGA